MGLESTDHYIDAGECIARGTKVEVEHQAEELKRSDGIVTRTEGLVQFMLKCGGYKGAVSAQIFPNMNQQMILGIPWLLKENSDINWAQVAVVMKKGISLPLAMSQQQNPVHLASEISAM